MVETRCRRPWGGRRFAVRQREEFGDARCVLYFPAYVGEEYLVVLVDFIHADEYAVQPGTPSSQKLPPWDLAAVCERNSDDEPGYPRRFGTVEESGADSVTSLICMRVV